MTAAARRLLLVDDHPVVRAGLRAFLELRGDLRVVAEAGSLAEAGERLAALREPDLPDLAIVDLKLPDGRGTSFIEPLRRAAPRARVLVLSSFLEDDAVREAMRGGAHGWLDKQQGPEALADAVRAVLRGEYPLAPGAVQALAERDHDPFAALTPRERQVLGGIAEGLTNLEIARRLGVSEKTVKTHAGHVYAKLDVRRRTQAAMLARERGFTDA